MRTQKRSKLTWCFSDVLCVGVQYAACHLPPHCARLALPKTDMSILPVQLLPFLTAGAPFKAFASLRDEWAVNDHYRCPGASVGLRYLSTYLPECMPACQPASLPASQTSPNVCCLCHLLTRDDSRLALSTGFSSLASTVGD